MDFTVYRVCSRRVVVVDEISEPVVTDEERGAVADTWLDPDEGIGGDVVAFVAPPPGEQARADAGVRFVVTGGVERNVDEAGLLATAEFVDAHVRKRQGAERPIRLSATGGLSGARVYSVERRAPLTADLWNRYAVNLGRLKRQTGFSTWERIRLRSGRDYLRVRPEVVGLRIRNGTISGKLDAYVAAVAEPHLVVFAGDEIPGLDPGESRDQFINDLLESCFPDVEGPDAQEALAGAQVLSAVGRYFAPFDDGQPAVAGVVAARAVEPGSLRYLAYDCPSSGRAAETGVSATTTVALAVTVGLCRAPVVARPAVPGHVEASGSPADLLATISQNHEGWLFEGSVRRLFSGRS